MAYVTQSRTLLARVWAAAPCCVIRCYSGDNVQKQGVHTRDTTSKLTAAEYEMLQQFTFTVTQYKPRLLTGTGCQDLPLLFSMSQESLTGPLSLSLSPFSLTRTVGGPATQIRGLPDTTAELDFLEINLLPLQERLLTRLKQKHPKRQQNCLNYADTSMSLTQDKTAPSELTVRSAAAGSGGSDCPPRGLITIIRNQPRKTENCTKRGYNMVRHATHRGCP